MSIKRTISIVLLLATILSTFVFSVPVAAAGDITITFDGNGGTISTPSVTIASGGTVDLTMIAPRKPSMEFMGWATSLKDADLGNVAYNHNTTGNVFYESTTLYAVWAYKVTLNNGFRGWGNDNVVLYKFPGKDLDLKHHKDDIINTYGMYPGSDNDLGCQMVFVEWNTNSLDIGRGNGTSYHEKYTANISTTLYCIWGYPTIYNADGGRFPASGAETFESFVSDFSYDGVFNTTTYGNFHFPQGENAPRKAGCRLVTDHEGNTVYARLFTDGVIAATERSVDGLHIPTFNPVGLSWSDFKTEVTSYGEGGMSYFAIWEPTVTYKANGGTGKDFSEYLTWQGETLYNYADYTVKANSFAKPGATFKGWNTKPDGTGKSYTAGSVISEFDSSDPIVLYAQWSDGSAVTESTVTFNAMGGELDVNKQAYKISYGEKFTDAVGEMPIPTKVGYVFHGWINVETGEPLLFDEEYYSTTENTAYCAQWAMHSQHINQALKNLATCQNPGHYTTTCKVCDYSDTVVYDTIPHSYESWVNLSGDMSNGGSKARFCTYCLTAEIAEYSGQKQEIIAYINAESAGTWKDDFAHIDVLNYLGAFVDNGPGNYPFGGAYFNSLNLLKQRARAQNPNAKILYTVCNRNTAVFESWLKTDATRAQLANAVVGIVQAYDLDGVDFDFEFPTGPEIRPLFVETMKQIRVSLNNLSAQTGKYYRLTVATPAANWGAEKYDLSALHPYIDYFNIMNYDLYCGTAVPFSHHHTPPFDNVDPTGRVPTGGSFQSDIQLYLSHGVPKSKIVGGMGLYSRRFLWVASTNNGLFQPGTVDETNIHYDMLILQYINKNGYVRYWDDTSKAPYLFNKSNGEFLTYDDPQSLTYKCQIATNQGIRGVMVFDYVTCDGAGIFSHIRQNLSTNQHTCIPGNISSSQVSCGSNGYIKQYCKICGSEMSHQEIFREGHYCEIWAVIKEATKDTAGEMVGNCVFCNTSMTKEIPPLGYTVTFDAGEGAMTSSNIYNVKKGESLADAIGTPNAVLSGTTLVEWYCAEYDYVYDPNDTFTIADDVTFTAIWENEGEHNHSYSSKVTKPATCTEDGIMTYTCRCAYSYTEVIPATGHAYDDGVITKDSTCSEPGEMTFTCANCRNSYTEEIASLNHTYTSHTTVAPTCTEDGVNTYTCENCSDSYTEPIPALGHSWKAWEIIKEATETEDGEQQRSCRRGCGTVETEVIPALGTEGDPAVKDVTNYTVTLSNITDIKEIRFAPGHYTTSTQIREAEGTLTLNASLVAANTDENGVFTYEVAKASEYTFWVRKNDGTSYFVHADTSDINTYLESDGLRLTVMDIKEADLIKDMWIAEGTWSNYSEIKNNATVKYQVTPVKLANYFATHDFTYTCLNPGAHTVLIRYNDGSYDTLYTTLTVEVPTFTKNGLQLTVGNIPDVKIIRTAYGKYNSVAEIKTASGLRNFNNKTAIKDAESYMIQYPESGVVTVIVEYNTGYRHVEHITIEQKEPSFVQDGNTVVIGNLDGLHMVRYAYGEYTTSNSIKKAPGAITLKSDAIDANGNIVIDLDKTGKWSFMVQYSDESFNFYLVDIA